MIKLIKLNKVDSTILFLKNNIGKYQDNFITQVTAKYQNNSICRTKDKDWSNFKNNWMTSYIIKENDLLMKYHLFNILNIKIIINSIENLCKEEFKKNIDIKIKFPNDLFINNKKISGVLSENLLFQNIKYYIFSFGLNLNNSNSNFGNLKNCLNLKDDIELDLFLYYYHKCLINNIQFKHELIDFYNNKLLFLDQKIILSDDKKEIIGNFKGLNHNGFGELQLESGKSINIMNGSIKLFK